MFSKLLLGMTLTLISASAIAQKTDMRQKLYAALPQTISIGSNVLNDAFSNSGNKKNTIITFPFSSEFIFKGTVISNEQRYDNMQIIIVRSIENNNAVLQITKTIAADKTIIFAGRILSNTAADGYEIKYRDNHYFLQKTETQKIMQPCNL